MRVLQIGSDRSKRGILFPGTPAMQRQEAYANVFGELTIVGFSRISDGAQVHHDEHLKIYPTNSRSRFFYIFDALRIAKKLPKPDVISAQDPFEAGLAGYLIARHFGVPLHLQAHTDLFSPEYARHSPLNRLRIVLASYLLKRAKGVRVVSQRIKSSIDKKIGNNVPITVLPIFVDTEKFRSAKIDAELAARFSAFAAKVLVVSRLEKEKNVGLAIRAFAASAPKDACLIIVGEGSRRAALASAARTLGISDRVFFEGARAAAPYYPLADIVLVTSHYEGYGLVIIEALAAGKPVLSTDVGIAREAGAIIASDAGFLDALARWAKDGPKEMHLQAYPYANFDGYVSAYCADVEACAARK